MANPFKTSKGAIQRKGNDNNNSTDDTFNSYDDSDSGKVYQDDLIIRIPKSSRRKKRRTRSAKHEYKKNVSKIGLVSPRKIDISECSHRIHKSQPIIEYLPSSGHKYKSKCKTYPPTPQDISAAEIKNSSKIKKHEIINELAIVKERLNLLENVIRENSKIETVKKISLKDFHWLAPVGKGGSGSIIKKCSISGYICAAKKIELKSSCQNTINGINNEINILSKLPPHVNICRFLFEKCFEGNICMFVSCYDDTLSNFLNIIRECFNPGFTKESIGSSIGAIFNPISELDICYISLGIANGLKHLHDNGIVHRDIKSSNILINYSVSYTDLIKILKNNKGFALTNILAEIVICDFDISEKINVLTKDSNVLESKGTPGFMPPEVPLSGEMSQSKLSTSVDIFSFGMLLVELITLYEPFPEIRHSSLKHDMITNGNIDPIPNNLKNRYKLVNKLFCKCVLPKDKRPSILDIIDTLSHCISLLRKK